MRNRDGPILSSFPSGHRGATGIAAMIGVMALVLAGCAGSKARDHALYPAMDAAWPQIAAHAERGGAEAEAIAQMTEALTERDATTVMALWPALRVAALVGIAERVDAGLLGPGVGDSLIETVHQFDRAVNRLIPEARGPRGPPG